MNNPTRLISYIYNTYLRGANSRKLMTFFAIILKTRRIYMKNEISTDIFNKNSNKLDDFNCEILKIPTYEEI